MSCDVARGMPEIISRAAGSSMMMAAKMLATAVIDANRFPAINRMMADPRVPDDAADLAVFDPSFRGIVVSRPGFNRCRREDSQGKGKNGNDVFHGVGGFESCGRARFCRLRARPTVARSKSSALFFCHYATSSLRARAIQTQRKATG